MHEHAPYQQWTARVKVTVMVLISVVPRLVAGLGAANSSTCYFFPITSQECVEEAMLLAPQQYPDVRTVLYSSLAVLWHVYTTKQSSRTYQLVPLDVIELYTLWNVRFIALGHLKGLRLICACRGMRSYSFRCGQKLVTRPTRQSASLRFPTPPASFQWSHQSQSEQGLWTVVLLLVHRLCWLSETDSDRDSKSNQHGGRNGRSDIDNDSDGVGR